MAIQLGHVDLLQTRLVNVPDFHQQPFLPQYPHHDCSSTRYDVQENLFGVLKEGLQLGESGQRFNKYLKTFFNNSLYLKTECDQIVGLRELSVSSPSIVQWNRVILMRVPHLQ